MVSRVKGTQDFLDMRLFNHIIKISEQHFTQYHFTQIATPIIESIDLFQRSLGEHTDVISKEMFIIQPRDGDESICLRPEATAPTMRAFLEARIQQTPWQVFSYGPMFRYERPQKGRFRQFHQMNIEIIDAQSIAQDVQLITMLDRLFHEKFQLQNYALLINFLGSREDRARYRDVLISFLDTVAYKICATCQQRRTLNPLRIFDCKNPQCQQEYESAPRIVDHLSDESRAEWEQLQAQLAALSISFSYEPRLVRGLDYYNKTVFEFVSTDLGAQNTFCGGGRYDYLAQELGASKMYPALGAAFGFERLILLLQAQQDQLRIAELPPLYTVLPQSHNQQTLALLIADTLRAAGLSTYAFLDGDSMKSMMRQANKMGAAYCVIIGDREQEQNQVMIKNMITGHEELVLQSHLLEAVRR